MEAGRELDTLIAEKVMADRLIKRGKWRGYWDCGRGMHHSDEDGGPLHYSTEIAAAWRVLEIMIDNGYDAEVTATRAMINYFAVFVSANGEHRWHAYADTAPHAICLAALEATGVEP